MKIAIFVLSAAFSFQAFAQSSSTSVSAVSAASVSETQPGVESQPPGSTGAIQPSSGENTARLKEVLKNKKFEEDHLITDAKLRADEGSFSKYSLKFNLSYYGPTVSDFSAADQPNPDKSPSPKETAIGGSFGGRYRIDPRHTISVGSGLKAVHPFHGMERVDLNTPYLSYDVSSRVAGVQMRNSPGISYVTIPNYTRIGEYATLDYNFSAVYDLGASGFAVGNDISFGYYLYNREYQRADGKASRSTISTSPFVKYNFSDKFSVNTSIGLSWYNPRSREKADSLVLLNSSVTQRIGMGYAITRDIFFAPYLSLFPGKLATDTTTMNLSTIFSIL